MIASISQCPSDGASRGRKDKVDVPPYDNNKENLMNQKQFVKASIMANMTGEGGQLNFEAAVGAIAIGLMSGDCPHGNEEVRTNEKKATSYAKAVVNNYLKKDKDLNGGVKYAPENPRGPRDDSKLKQLESTIGVLEAAGETATLEAVKAAIEARKAEIEAAKTTKVGKSLDQIKADLLAMGVAI